MLQLNLFETLCFTKDGIHKKHSSGYTSFHKTLNYSIIGDGLFVVTGVVQTIHSKQLMLGKLSGSQAW